MTIRTKFVLIMGLGVVAGLLAYPREDQLLSLIGLKHHHLSVRQGLDLQGGAHLEYQADLSKTAASDRNDAMNSLVAVIGRRVNPGGTSETVVQRSGTDRVIIECPGNNPNCTTATIGQTANLTFLELPTAASSLAQAVPTDVSGKDVQRADPDFDTQRNAWVVTLKLKTGTSTRNFADLTTRINKTAGQLVTLLDQQVVFGPATVNEPIIDGTAELSGNFTVDQAKEIALQINSGALPVPITLQQQRSVGPTLGRDSVVRSLVAGIIGLSVVALFMIAYYRLAGLLAVGALTIYTLLTLTIYKLSALTPYAIVLTLAGVAGFILSIGMAVDANILIFERLKEELRAGKSFVAAVEAGCARAWPSIRDSNVSTLITCLILYTFGATIIKGFAVTLGLGVLISMFTAVVISRTFLRLIIRTRWGARPRWYGVKVEERR